MARPRKQADERRNTSLRCDLTLAEKNYVREQALKAGLSEAEYTRRRVLGYSVAPARNAGRSDPALVNEINRLGNQVASLGNLANQVAVYCHTGRRISSEWEILPSEIKGINRLVEQTLERIFFGYGSQNS